MRINTKNLILLVIFLCCVGVSVGQTLVLTGHVAGGVAGNPVELNLPFSDTYYKDNSVITKLDPKGDFCFVGKGDKPAMYLVVFHDSIKQWVLLCPGVPLDVEINPDSAQGAAQFSGPAKSANEFLFGEERSNGSWLTAGLGSKGTRIYGRFDNPFVRWPAGSVINFLLPMVKSSLDSARQRVALTHFPAQMKKFLSTEIGYYYAMRLDTQIRFHAVWWGGQSEGRRGVVDTMMVTLPGAVGSLFPMPREEDLGGSLSARAWSIRLGQMNYESLLHAVYPTDPAQFYERVGMTRREQDSLEKLFGSYGDFYAYAVARSHLLPAYAADRWLVDNIYNDLVRGAAIEVAEMLNRYLQHAYPQSRFLRVANREIVRYKRLAAGRDTGDSPVHIRPDYASCNTLAALLAPYKGKVVFLDFWGTWCHACIDEFKDVPDLHARFRGKEVVFLYVAANDDGQDRVWRDLIHIRNIEGEHVRRTFARIGAYWEALGIGSRGYPHYCLFDREGRLVVKDVKLPSDKEELYAQIDAVLQE